MITDSSIHRCTCGTWCIGRRPCTTCTRQPLERRGGALNNVGEGAGHSSATQVAR